jgi:hypothetical protein
LRIKADCIEEYEREHTRVWPELLAKLKAVGISDYSIFPARTGSDRGAAVARISIARGTSLDRDSGESAVAGVYGTAVRAGAG